MTDDLISRAAALAAITLGNTVTQLHAAIRALPADLAAKADSCQSVRVKPLVWEQLQSTLPRVVFEAKSCFGRYVAWPNGNWKLYGAYGYKQEGDINTAMAAAQADYEQRILAAIETQPDPRDTEVISGLVEAAQKTMAAAELREAYHRLPNDKNRIGAAKSPKSKARDAWLKSFRRATSATSAALAAAKGGAA